jgi:hypothetical protein
MSGCGSADQVVLGQGSDDAAGPERVVAYVLVNVTSSADERVLADGDTINVTTPPGTLRVQTEPAVVGSVEFYLDGNYVRTENHSLYAIAGNNLGTGLYNPWTIAPGSHVVKAIPYTGMYHQGTPGVALEQTFVIQ